MGTLGWDSTTSRGERKKTAHTQGWKGRTRTGKTMVINIYCFWFLNLNVWFFSVLCFVFHLPSRCPIGTVSQPDRKGAIFTSPPSFPPSVSLLHGRFSSHLPQDSINCVSPHFFIRWFVQLQKTLLAVQLGRHRGLGPVSQITHRPSLRARKWLTRRTRLKTFRAEGLRLGGFYLWHIYPAGSLPVSLRSYNMPYLGKTDKENSHSSS